jgi:hypothetical protein
VVQTVVEAVAKTVIAAAEAQAIEKVVSSCKITTVKLLLSKGRRKRSKYDNSEGVEKPG